MAAALRAAGPEDETQAPAVPAEEVEHTPAMQALLSREDDTAGKNPKEEVKGIEPLPLPEVPEYDAITRRKQFQQKNDLKKEKAERKLAKAQGKVEGTQDASEIHARKTRKARSDKGKSSAEKAKARQSAKKSHAKDGKAKSSKLPKARQFQKVLGQQWEGSEVRQGLEKEQESAASGRA